MNEPLRLGLVGCGRLAEAGYAPALAHAPAVEVVAVADPDAGRRVAVGEALSIDPARRHEDVEALLAAEDGGTAARLEAVLIASPVATHVDVASRAVAAGLPALVEKPPASWRAIANFSGTTGSADVTLTDVRKVRVEGGVSSEMHGSFVATMPEISRHGSPPRQPASPFRRGARVLAPVRDIGHSRCGRTLGQSWSG